MLNWLRNLIGNPPPVTQNIFIDDGAISVASTGDTVLINPGRLLKTNERAQYAEALKSLRAQYPTLSFLIVEQGVSMSHAPSLSVKAGAIDRQWGATDSSSTEARRRHFASLVSGGVGGAPTPPAPFPDGVSGIPCVVRTSYGTDVPRDEVGCPIAPSRFGPGAFDLATRTISFVLDDKDCPCRIPPAGTGVAAESQHPPTPGEAL